MFLLLVAVVAGIVFYAFKIEPYRIVREVYDLNEQSGGEQKLKIVQFSDVHIKKDFTSENLENVITLINEQNADLVIFTGDLYDNYARYHEDAAVISQLQNIHARYAKIAIWGNRDYGGGASRHYEDIMSASGFRLLENSSTIVSVNGREVLITGLDDSLLGEPKMPDVSAFNDADYKLILTHEPDTIADYRDEDYDLALSGHSHGGQFNVPFIPFLNKKAIETSELSALYTSGMYNVNADGVKKIFVNTGIGTTHISARFGVVPKISVFNVYLA